MKRVVFKIQGLDCAEALRFPPPQRQQVGIRGGEQQQRAQNSMPRWAGTPAL